jgi:hypothetical protein
MLHRFRRFSSFIDPFSISHLFARSKTISQILDEFSLQKPVFSNKEHAVSFLLHLRRLRTDSNLSYSMNDTRLQEFIHKVNSEDSEDVYSDIIYEFAIFYKAAKIPPHEEVKNGFDRFLESKIDHLSLKSAAKCIYALHLMYPPKAEYIKKGKKLTERLTKVLQTEMPTKEDSLNIVIACREL